MSSFICPVGYYCFQLATLINTSEHRHWSPIWWDTVVQHFTDFPFDSARPTKDIAFHNLSKRFSSCYTICVCHAMAASRAQSVKLLESMVPHLQMPWILGNERTCDEHRYILFWWLQNNCWSTDLNGFILLPSFLFRSSSGNNLCFCVTSMIFQLWSRDLLAPTHHRSCPHVMYVLALKTELPKGCS